MSLALELNFIEDTPCEDWDNLPHKENCPIRENFEDRDGYAMCWLCGWRVYYNQEQRELPNDVEPK